MTQATTTLTRAGTEYALTDNGRKLVSIIGQIKLLDDEIQRT